MHDEDQTVTLTTNELWNDSAQTSPRISVLTPLYNGEGTLERTIRSVFAQSYRDFEYIIVDDGSEDDGGVIARRYLEQNQVPMMLITKPNGGVHTARNRAVEHSRGEYAIFIDADDELLPEALSTALHAWESIPEDLRSQYREVVGLCLDGATGEILGDLFPDHINEVPWEDARKMYASCRKGEHIGVHRTSILKANPHPEPEGVKYVAHSILWDRLAQQYRSYYINEALRIYYVECSVLKPLSLARPLQTYVDIRWNDMYRLNHRSEYGMSFKTHCRCLIDYAKNDCRVNMLDPDFATRRAALVRPADRISCRLIRIMIRAFYFIKYYILRNPNPYKTGCSGQYLQGTEKDSTKRLKILFYNGHLKHGGAARVLTNLANQFCREGEDVYFMVDEEAKGMEYPLDPAVKRFHIRDGELPHRRFRGIGRLVEFRIRKKYMKSAGFDIAVSFLHSSDLKLYITTRGMHCKILLSIRNDPAVLYPPKTGRALIARYIYGHADGVVFQTEEAKQWLGREDPGVRVIWNQTAPVFYNTPLSDDRKNILAVGRFVEQKDHMMLLEAFSRIADRVTDDLILCGEGELRTQYERFIEEKGLRGRVHFPGQSHHMEEVLSQSRLFVLSSVHEGLPNALMEAMAMGLPCIATDCPCGGPGLLDGGTGSIRLIGVHDTDALAESMLTLLTNPEYAARLGRKAKERAQLFRPEVVFEEWKDFVYDLCGKN